MRFRPGRPRRPGSFGPRRNGRQVAATLLAQLNRAHRLLAEGHPPEAAPIFADLAQQAEALNMPRRAMHLHLQASRCYFQAHDSGAGLNHARASLQLATNLGQPERVSNILLRLIANLRANGFNVEAEALQKEFGAQFGTTESDSHPHIPPEPETRGQLPTKCPSCNGPIRSDEVEWIDAQSAECPYCGGTLQVE